jgi:hypothetical protein
MMILGVYMNKRKEPTTARSSRKARNEVRKGMKLETKIPSKTVKVKADAASRTVKKHAKRTSPKEKIEGSSPAHIHTENERWVKSLRKQTILKASRLTKKLAKKH